MIIVTMLFAISQAAHLPQRDLSLLFVNYPNVIQRQDLGVGALPSSG